MAEIVLFSVGLRPGELDREERRYELAPVSHSSELLAYMDTVESDWRSAGDRTEAFAVSYLFASEYDSGIR